MLLLVVMTLAGLLGLRHVLLAWMQAIILKFKVEN